MPDGGAFNLTDNTMVDQNERFCSCHCDCQYEFSQLIDDLIKDIQHLESETVRTRYELSRHLTYPYNEYLRSDILSDLGRRYSDHPTYSRLRIIAIPANLQKPGVMRMQ